MLLSIPFHKLLAFLCFYVQGSRICKKLGKGFLKRKIIQKKKKPQETTLMAPPHEREEDHRLTDIEIIKVDTTFCHVIGP